jgi:NhaP-type Na+/H+ or K+/H+ antiporter
LPQLEIILGLLVAVAALATLAVRLRIPYPILLVLGGSLLGFVPKLPRVDLDPEGVEERSSAYQRLMAELLHAQRQTLVRLRDEGKIADEAMHRIERDLEESRLEA